MNISLDSYRAAIGTWHSVYINGIKIKSKILLAPIKIRTLLGIVLSSFGVCIGILLILRCGDVYQNPGPTFENKALNICSINIQSLYLLADNYHRRKIDEIHASLVNELQVDIITLSETWLKPNIPDNKVEIPGYTFYRKDRIGLRSGGAGMYVSDSLPHRKVPELMHDNIELLWVEITLGVKKILVGSCYRPPGQNSEEVDSFMTHLSDSIDRVLTKNMESVVLLGDFNDTCTTWESDHKESDLKLKLYDLVNASDLHQMVHEPTHITGQAANLLDLLITDSPGYIIKQQLLPPIGSFHQIVHVIFKIQYKRDKIFTREIWDYKNGDYEGLNNDLPNVPWGVGDTFDDVDDAANFWQKSFLEACKSKIPFRQIKIRPMDKPWINNNVKKQIRHRNRLYKRFKRTKLPIHQEIWKHAAKETNYIMSVAKKEHIEKIRSRLMNISIGEKNYWKLAKEVYGNKKTLGIPSLIINDKTVNTSSEKAACFNEYFTDQQTLPPLRFNQQLPPIIFLTDSRLEFIQTNPDEIQSIIKTFDVGKASGPDGISIRLLKETSVSISPSLSKLLNKSFTLAKVPKIWKEANICPIFKKTDRTKVENYRPISLLSCVGKIQERIVYRHLYKYLTKNNLLTWKNSGFKELDSAINQLLYITNNIHKALESGKEICMVFLDVSKAFDRVWHSGVLNKLRCMGIEGRLFDWFCDYLSDRKIRVVVNGQKSEWLRPNAGVPQGSILGPLLFLVFINDITLNIESNINLFADDTSLMEIIENYVDSYAKLNRDLYRLSTWANKWLVTFNANKTVYIKISRKVNVTPKPILYLNGEIIKEVSTHKHLGLTFNQTLTWSDHIKLLSSKAAQCVGLLRRICRDVPRECLEILYKYMIRPLLEYGDVIFDGTADIHLKKLEDVQRQAALACTGAYRHTKHDILLDELGWPPLALRRKNHRMSQMYKIQMGLAPTYLTNSCPPLTKDRTTYNLRSGMNITSPQIRTSTYQNSYFPNSIKEWNTLDPNLRTAQSLSAFRDRQKKAVNSKYKTNPLFHHSNGQEAINHTRIRLGLSGLASQRFDYNHIDSPKCTRCPSQNEDPVHFFLMCPAFEDDREDLIRNVCDILNQNDIQIDLGAPYLGEEFVEMLLKGTPLVNEVENKKILKIAQTYIKNTHRFP
jgi:exonuclease III